jgi:hypothetical protein
MAVMVIFWRILSGGTMQPTARGQGHADHRDPPPEPKATVVRPVSRRLIRTGSWPGILGSVRRLYLSTLRRRPARIPDAARYGKRARSRDPSTRPAIRARPFPSEAIVPAVRPCRVLLSRLRCPAAAPSALIIHVKAHHVNANCLLPTSIASALTRLLRSNRYAGASILSV